MVHHSIVVFACIATAAHAVLLPGAGYIQPTLLTKQVETIDVRPQYTFSYEVKDPKTGDIKNQIESRDGDVVKGSYSLLDADGLTRVVQYSSDSENGFNAIVSRTPQTKQVVAAAPTLIKSVPILQQSQLLQAPTYIRSIGAPAYSSSSLVRAPPSIGLAVKSVPTLLQAPTLIRSYAAPAYSSSSLVRAPPSIGLAVKSSPLLSSSLYSSSLLYH